MAGSAIERLLENLERAGFVDVVLPFLLIFTIMYAVFQKTHILGEKKKNFNAVVSLIIALLVVIPHVTRRYPPDSDPITILNNAIPQVSLIIVAVIFLLILIGVFGQEKVFLGLAAPGWVMFISIIIIVAIFGGSAGWWDGKFEQWMIYYFGPDAIAWVVIILVFGLIFMFITSEPSEEKGLKKVGIDVSQLFGGGKH
ncbi:TPA: hypothetical protein HA281_04285 [Candidatus Woesearchaeota archaeon]|nr:MAG: hypothetical protein QT04_C0046G0021 [archaeon GW2011_AR11]MBS3110929.1 hypothetical protein [Candidatus Woesearchaeota archaeon]HIH05526.1 hypothetical protein [Candidatus Woesearchaeota archaeon]HIH91997.1 hypothetical protein [Candidatus Woesearchaeota archaeon]HII64570.1 hypothetical protein [Candidatus Woesearchaeota archaeon]